MMDNEVKSTIKLQRDGFNHIIEKARDERRQALIRAHDAKLMLLQSIMTISLGIGAAIIPLLLLADNLSLEDRIFLSIGSGLFLVNTFYITFSVQRIVQNLSYSAQASGLEEETVAKKFRNMLTKSLLTNEMRYFREYNVESRRFANTVTDALGQFRKKIELFDDVATTVLVIGVMFVARSLFPFIATVHYVALIVTVFVYLGLRTIFSMRRAQKEIDRIAELHDEAIKPEKDINEFVDKLMNDNRK